MKSLTIALYQICIFLFLLPSMPILGTFTYVIGKSISIILFLIIVYQLITEKKSFKLPNILTVIILSLFLSEGLSVIHSINLDNFIDRFADSLLVLLFFVSSIVCLRNMQKSDYKKTMYIILAAITLNIFTEISIFIFKQNVIPIFTFLFHPGYVEHIFMDLERNRIYSEMHLETFIPLGFYSLINGKNSIKLFSFFIFPIVFISFISNFRSRIIMSFFALIASSIIFIKKSIVLVTLSLVALCICLFAIAQFMMSSYGFSVVDRLLLGNNEADVLTIESRFDQYKKAFEVGQAYPFFGIGLGQYDYYIYNNAVEYGRNTNNQYQKTIWTDTNTPHNILFIRFVETGFIGLTSYIMLLIYLTVIDLVNFNQKDELIKAIILCFWTLNIYSIFNPTLHFGFMILFWSLRSYIYVLDSKKHQQLHNHQNKIDLY